MSSGKNNPDESVLSVDNTKDLMEAGQQLLHEKDNVYNYYNDYQKNYGHDEPKVEFVKYAPPPPALIRSRA